MVGNPQPEDGQPLPFWKARRFIRNVVWLIGGLVIVYLLALSLQQSRENKELALQLEQQILNDRRATIDSLANLLVIVKGVEQRSLEAGVEPDVTLEEATEALKESFPPELVDEAVKRAIDNNGTTATTTSSTTTTTTRRTTTTTAAAGPPGPPGPQGPPGPPSPAPTTTTTTRPPCLLGIAGICIIGG